MDFFTAQDHARRNTGRLVSFFFLAVLSLIVLTNLVVMLVFGFFRPASDMNLSQPPFDWAVFFGIGSAVLGIVALGSLYKVSRLSRGGDAIAAMYGAKPVFADDTDLAHQRLVHVVEEMAIASGTPVPQVYILEEEGINAFFACFSTSNAIIAVTKGALRTLNREQLQGVIARRRSADSGNFWPMLQQCSLPEIPTASVGRFCVLVHISKDLCLPIRKLKN